ncbi:MAG: Lrp/AsnC family transcriptional regulator [Granulosicoccus sp.]|nr:Lrp/AsnC family transcriptional regulator [Granulosicoccus sp.]
MQITIDDVDRSLLKQLQTDSSLSMDRLAQTVGISKTSAWNRVQRLQQNGVIKRQVAVLNAELLGLHETFFIAIKTNQHNQKWLVKFNAVINRFPEIIEAHRLSGETDYLLKIQVGSTREFDDLYKRIVSLVDLFSVTSSLSMEVLKQETRLPL